jgi:hypothetical protein
VRIELFGFEELIFGDDKEINQNHALYTLPNDVFLVFTPFHHLCLRILQGFGHSCGIAQVF